MEAAYARQIALAKQSLMDENELNSILNSIKTASSNGDLSVRIHRNLSQETIRKLENPPLSYKIERAIPTNGESEGITYRISW